LSRWVPWIEQAGSLCPVITAPVINHHLWHDGASPGPRHRAKAHAIDRSARNLARDRGLLRYKERGRKLAPGVFAGPGPVIGALVPGAKKALRATWEDMLTVIAGPRTGKTTCYAVPAVLDAPGPVIVTSNKRDIVDATRGAREAAAAAFGGCCWVFDPQGVAGAGARWWWGPLSYVTDVRSARKLAAVWTNASKEPGDRTDACLFTG
jgi:hypothetical protein